MKAIQLTAPSLSAFPQRGRGGRDCVHDRLCRRIVPVIDQTFDIGETAAAYAELNAGGRHFGTIAIVQ